MEIAIRTLYNEQKHNTGAILTAIIQKPTNQEQKANIENRLTQYAENNLFPGKGLLIYSNVNTDTASVTVINSIDNLTSTTHTIDFT